MNHDVTDTPRVDAQPLLKCDKLTFRQIGIDKNLAHRARRYGAMTHDEFEADIMRSREWRLRWQRREIVCPEECSKDGTHIDWYRGLCPKHYAKWLRSRHRFKDLV